MTTEKRHIYGASTTNVVLGEKVIKQDINYHAGKTQSVTKSVSRFYEHRGRRFMDNQIFDGLAISIDTNSIDIASGTCFIAGRWITIDATSIDFSSPLIDADDWNILIHLSGTAGESDTRDPVSDGSVNITREADGDYDSAHNTKDFKLYLGQTTWDGISAHTNLISIAGRRSMVDFILPYHTSSDITVKTGNASDSYDLAFNFGTSSNISYLDLDLNNNDLLQVTNINSHTVPAGSDDFVTLDAQQTLGGKILTTPTIADYTSGTHDHEDAAGGGTLDINAANDGTDLTVANGGTGVSTIPSNAIPFGQGASPIDTFTLSEGKIPVGSVTSVPTAQTHTTTLTGKVTGAASMGADGNISITTTKNTVMTLNPSFLKGEAPDSTGHLVSSSINQYFSLPVPVGGSNEFTRVDIRLTYGTGAESCTLYLYRINDAVQTLVDSTIFTSNVGYLTKSNTFTETVLSTYSYMLRLESHVDALPVTISSITVTYAET